MTQYKTISNKKFLSINETVYNPRDCVIGVSDNASTQMYYWKSNLAGVPKTRNILVAIEYSLKDAIVVKALFDEKNLNLKEATKRFGKIFNTNGYVR